MLMLDLTYDLFHLLDQRRLTVRARHIPGRLNRLADLLSRPDQVVNTEWTLSYSVVQLLWSLWGRPTVDLMATYLNNRLPTFVSPFPHELAHQVDAMSFTWDRLDAYLFPPWSMIRPVLLKLKHEKNCLLTLIVPRWPGQPWFTELLSLLCEIPRRLPLRPDLLVMPISGTTHQSVHILELHACRVSSSPSRNEAFRKQCQRDSRRATSERRRSSSMSPSGRPTHFGAKDGISIPALPLTVK